MADQLPTLIVPDVHEDIDTLRRLIEVADLTGVPVVFLGDMFDTFGVRHIETADLYASLYQKPGWTVLLGNHDVQYISNPISRSPLLCSGYDRRTQSRVTQMLDQHPELSAQFRLTTLVHGWVVSHAGITSGWMKSAGLDHVCDVNEAFRYAWNRTPFALTEHPVFAAGADRGGLVPYGGPLWCDFQSLAYDANPLGNQIVGHTVGQTIRRRFTYASDRTTIQSMAICLDTALQHVALVYPRMHPLEPARVQVVQIPKGDTSRLQERIQTPPDSLTFVRDRALMCDETPKQAASRTTDDVIRYL